MADDDFVPPEDEETPIEEMPEMRGRYQFLEVVEEPEEVEPDEPPMRVKKWSLGSHSQGGDEAREDIEAALQGLDDEVDADLKGVLEEAAGMVSGASIHDFECSVCGLNHGHSDTKHDIRSAFSVRDEFAEEMEFSPFCHCGVNELAMLVDYYGYIPVAMFSDGYEFEAVAEADAETVDVLLTTYSQVKNEERVREPMRYAATEAGFSMESLEQVKAFLRRVNDIKSAASGAPISSETRADIDDLRKNEVEERVQR